MSAIKRSAYLSLKPGIMLLLALAVSGCSQARENGSSAGNLGGINHTAAAINYVKVNGYGGPNISPFGEGGGYCCVMLPDKWFPGLMAHVEWETDPNPHARLPPLGTDEFRAAYKKHEASYQRHQVDIEIPKYDHSCGLTVHFLPCNQIKVTAACAMYGQPNYPIKEPLHMKEPASCPK